ncbi:MAG: ATP-dependent endonuclease [Cyanobacteria bacterium SIG28]|nr:ATP-dependent endonuclease [Cyanobacteria bacterium SIG28]
MQYKKLTKEQILISIDRLTRFKNTKEKYLRVFLDILSTSLIEPKLKKSEMLTMDYSQISEYVSEIINASLNSEFEDNIINNILRDYENSVFHNDNETQLLLNNNINYNAVIKILPESCPVNMKWLSKLAFTKNYRDIRQQELLKYPIEEVILVEGITEEILLPAFSRYLGYDFYAHGIQIIPAGGKNQVVKMYYELAQQLKIPIFVLLDKDAEENIRQINPRLRENDRIHLVSCGEFEDLLPKELILRTINSHFKNFLTLNEEDLKINGSTVNILEDIFKNKGLHEFKKAEFAKLVKDNIHSESDISDEIRTIINEIRFTNKSLDTDFCS